MNSYIKYLILFAVVINPFKLISQTDTVKKIIFIPHPRSDDKVNQSSNNTIEYIDFSKFDMKILGGDLTYYTSTNATSMEYCNTVYDLSNVNTLWTLGNHDTQDRSLIENYTLRPSYYAYYKDSITFVILDTELDKDGFIYSNISGDQLTFFQHLTDTISISKYLIIAHHRILWMLNNEDMKPYKDSVGASTREMDTSNFYAEVYPLVQKVKSKGIPVLFLGGDRSDIIIDYEPEDSINMLTAVMVPEFSDEKNNVLILKQNLNSTQLTWEWVSLNDIEKVKFPATSPNLYKKLIYLPHIYSVATHDVINSIKLIDYSKFDMIMLGGDLNYSSSAKIETLEKLDTLFNLRSETTLWSLGNHDVDNRDNLMQVTQKNTFYSYYADSVTFLVLDTELDAEINNYVFKNSFFSGEQLELIKNVTDTISKSKYLFVLHYRLVWMLGIPELEPYLDSVGKSTYEMDTVNYYQEVYPRLQEVKKRGIEIISLSGDKISTNLIYTPEDSMTFLISTIISDKGDDDNYAIIFKQNRNTLDITWEFVPISEIEKIEIPPDTSTSLNNSFLNHAKVFPNPSNGHFTVELDGLELSKLEIFNIIGEKIDCNINYFNNNSAEIEIKNTGIYFIKISLSNANIVRKIEIY